MFFKKVYSQIYQFEPPVEVQTSAKQAIRNYTTCFIRNHNYMTIQSNNVLLNHVYLTLYVLTLFHSIRHCVLI